MSRRVVIAIACLFGFAAHAEPGPLMLPSRDVDVTYQMPRPGAAAGEAPLSQRIRWAASEQKLRVDPPRPGLYLVVDYRAHVVSAVRTAERLVLQIPSGDAGIQPGMPAGIPSGGSGKAFVSQGDSEVANLRCTEWRTSDAAGEASVVCLTGDGVLLRARVGDQVVAEATSVAYGPVDPALFVVPDAFRRVVPGRLP